MFLFQNKFRYRKQIIFVFWAQNLKYYYRFPSLFVVDSFFKYWTANFETANKKANVKLKLKDWFCEKGSFWTTNEQNRR